MKSAIEIEKLFYTNFNALVVYKQDFFAGIIDGLIRTGFIPYEEFDDLLQNINEILLKNASTYQQNFKGTGSLNGYLYRVIINISKSYILQSLNQRNEVKIFDKLFNIEDSMITQEDKMLITHELKVLKLILNKYETKRKHFIELFLKLIIRFPVEGHDVYHAYSDLKLDVCNSISIRLNELNPCSDKTIFTELADSIKESRYNHKTPESMLHDVRREIRSFIKILNNSNPNRSTFSPETFQILAELYFDQERSILR